MIVTLLVVLLPPDSSTIAVIRQTVLRQYSVESICDASPFHLLFILSSPPLLLFVIPTPKTMRHQTPSHLLQKPLYDPPHPPQTHTETQSEDTELLQYIRTVRGKVQRIVRSVERDQSRLVRRGWAWGGGVRGRGVS